MEYSISVRISFPRMISRVLRKEKNRFVTKYGSSYKSEPHITLYLGRYTKQGFPKLIRDLQSLLVKRFTISLLNPKITSEKELRRKLFFVDVSNKRQLHTLHTEVLKVAVRYRGSLLRWKDQERLRKGLYGKVERKNLSFYGFASALQLFEPHITLGEVGINDPQPKLADVQKNLSPVKGERVVVSSFTVGFYGKRNSKEKAKLMKEVTIRLL